MAKRSFLVPVAVALAVLTLDVGATAINTSDTRTPITHTQANESYTQAAALNDGALVAPGEELFGFVLKRSEGGGVFAGHSSHRSHRSHSSHRSHYSSR